MAIQSQRESGWFTWMRWNPTSTTLLVESEEKMFRAVKRSYRKRFVKLQNGNEIWTVSFSENIKSKTPLVIINGMIGGVGLWVLNYDALSEIRPLHAFDLLGFGRSSRPVFKADALQAENQFVDSIEQWRNAMGLNDMILMGHGLGGFVASSYALKYPERIKHLLLVDPWGFPVLKEDADRFPFWARGLMRIFGLFNPLAAIRIAGPFGPLLLRLRGDLGEKFSELSENGGSSPVFDYIYHCNAQNPSGEIGFKNLTVKIGFAQNPMIKRIGGLKPGIPVSFIYGARTWMEIALGNETQKILPRNDVQVYSIKAAGHHVYADQPENFHKVVNSISDTVD